MRAGFLLLPVVLATAGLTMSLSSESGDAYVERVIDGDTVVLGDGSKVRLIGIDAPEADAPCGQLATNALRRVVEDRVVTVGNPDSVQDEDEYGRLLRYLDTDDDPAASLLTAGLAVTRYDSSDGYDPHPRQSRYHALATAAFPACPTLDPDSRWYLDPVGYHRHVEIGRLALKNRAEKRAERQNERLERQQERRERQKERRKAQRREQQRREFERDMDSSDDDPGQPDGGYTGPRCYAPGGKTWVPC